MDDPSEKPPETPATPAGAGPESVAYDPQGTAKATHDLRVDKHETPEKHLLEPLTSGTDKKETVTIPVEEYQELSKFADLMMIGVDWELTDIPEPDQEKVEELIKNKNIEHLIASQTAALKRQHQAELETAVKKAVDEAKRSSSQKTKNKKAGLLIAMGVAFVLGVLGTWALSPKKPRGPAPDQPGSIRTLELEPKVHLEMFEGIIAQAQNEIIWVTTAPADQRILNAIAAARKVRPVSVFIITGTETEALALEVSRRYNFTCFRLNNTLGPINWVVVDQTQFLDGTTRFGVSLFQDAAKAKNVIDWVATTLDPNMTIAYRAR